MVSFEMLEGGWDAFQWGSMSKLPLVWIAGLILDIHWHGTAQFAILDTRSLFALNYSA